MYEIPFNNIFTAKFVFDKNPRKRPTIEIDSIFPSLSTDLLFKVKS